MRRFWNKVDMPDVCWEWQASRINDRGIKTYGRISINGKIVSAHRFVYQQFYGLIPKGMFICHTCDNPRCVNPKHLFLGSPMDNVQDKIKKKRFFKKVLCVRGHARTEENVDLWGNCKICKKLVSMKKGKSDEP